MSQNEETMSYPDKDKVYVPNPNANPELMVSIDSREKALAFGFDEEFADMIQAAVDRAKKRGPVSYREIRPQKFTK